MPLFYQSIYHSPIGDIEISGNESGIASLYFRDGENSYTEIHTSLLNCYNQLDEYFNGTRKNFDPKLNLQGTEFQLNVWKQLMKIPFGITISYLDLARSLGNRNLIRAVGRANGSNPISIIVPCHRVVGSKGDLTGYGGGIWRKRWLLDYEISFTQAKLF